MSTGPAGNGSVSPSLVIQSTALGPRSRISHGANGTIHLLTTLRLHDDPGAIVYKEYAAHINVPSQGLLNIVRARLKLAAPRRAALDELTVWPLRVVLDGRGTPTGVLMRLIPDGYFQTMALPSGKRERVPTEVQHLIFDAAVARRRAIDVPAENDLKTRLQICASVAQGVGLMHGMDIVYGDLSARNVLYRMVGRPSALMVDCDAVRVRGSAAVNHQLNSPDWEPPETRAYSTGSIPQSLATDRYKLALLILRCLRPGRGSSRSRDWQGVSRLLDAQGTKLMRLALTGRPEDRPRARDWVEYLRGAISWAPGQPTRGPWPKGLGGWTRP